MFVVTSRRDTLTGGSTGAGILTGMSGDPSLPRRVEINVVLFQQAYGRQFWVDTGGTYGRRKDVSRVGVFSKVAAVPKILRVQPEIVADYTTIRAANECIAAHGAARGGDGDERERVATAARCVICVQWRHARGGGADGAGRVGCGGGNVTSAQGAQVGRDPPGGGGGDGWCRWASWVGSAERSTSSRGAPTTFSHQVSVHTLGKDYHALTRRFQFDRDGAKLKVRKLEACAGVSKSASRRRSAIPARRPCDVPLASALAGRAVPAPAAHVVHAAEWLARVVSQINPDQHDDGVWGLRRDVPSVQ
ncbi:hypothetical protein B0H10DRAFT_2186904 [Mycena sp. CBHHK59/15]|nr:hypothetical protein B0H10DRAFT_2186904 [Mycena sp. CBHHK59/15]